MRTETTVEIEGFVGGEGSTGGEDEKKGGENGSLKLEFRLKDPGNPFSPTSFSLILFTRNMKSQVGFVKKYDVFSCIS